MLQACVSLSDRCSFILQCSDPPVCSMQTAEEKLTRNAVMYCIVTKQGYVTVQEKNTFQGSIMEDEGSSLNVWSAQQKTV